MFVFNINAMDNAEQKYARHLAGKALDATGTMLEEVKHEMATLYHSCSDDPIIAACYVATLLCPYEHDKTGQDLLDTIEEIARIHKKYPGVMQIAKLYAAILNVRAKNETDDALSETVAEITGIYNDFQTEEPIAEEYARVLQVESFLLEKDSEYLSKKEKVRVKEIITILHGLYRKFPMNSTMASTLAMAVLLPWNDSYSITENEFSSTFKVLKSLYHAFPNEELIVSAYTKGLALWADTLTGWELENAVYELVHLSERFPCNSFIETWAKIGISPWVFNR